MAGCTTCPWESDTPQNNPRPPADTPSPGPVRLHVYVRPRRNVVDFVCTRTKRPPTSIPTSYVDESPYGFNTVIPICRARAMKHSSAHSPCSLHVRNKNSPGSSPPLIAVLSTPSPRRLSCPLLRHPEHLHYPPRTLILSPPIKKDGFSPSRNPFAFETLKLSSCGSLDPSPQAYLLFSPLFLEYQAAQGI